MGRNLYVFDKRYRKKLESAHPIKIENKFLENLPAEIYGNALVSTNKLVSIDWLAQMVNDVLIQFRFRAFITSIFSFNVHSVFFSKASL